ncbi:MAG: M23 family metallopeptidase, partial [Reyranellaceae bacterium]
GMSAVVLLMLAVCVGLPLAYSLRLLRLNEASLASWGLAAAETTIIVALAMLLGRWDMAGYYTRIVLLVVFPAAVVWSLVRHRTRPAWLGPDTLRNRWPSLLSLVLFGGILAYVIHGVVPPDRSHALAFPLADGRFMVGQGGGNPLLNRHAGHEAQRFAVDITALNAFGVRADGLLPDDLDSYAIFGASVVSPCDGQIVEARDGLPDVLPPQRDRDNPSGNHVVVDCGGFDVELAHLRKDSVAVAAGERVAVGDRIGEVGNSGNTTEPHLHIHAVDRRTGAGLPFTFDGRKPVRNGLFVE